MADLVSAIVPAYNAAAFVAETLASITKQSHGDLEVVITDDASTDETFDVVEAARREDPRIRSFRNVVNKGTALSRNRCIQESRGRFIAFCDADDVWLPGKLQAQLRFMKERHAAVSFTAYEVVNRLGERSGRMIDTNVPESVGYVDMLKKRATMGCSTVMVDRSALPNLRMPDIPTGQDYATWLSILKAGHRAHCVREVFTLYRIRPGSISRNKLKKAWRQWRIYREIEGLDLLRASQFFVNYAWRAVFRD